MASPILKPVVLLLLAAAAILAGICSAGEAGGPRITGTMGKAEQLLGGGKEAVFRCFGCLRPGVSVEERKDRWFHAIISPVDFAEKGEAGTHRPFRLTETPKH